MPNRKEIGSEAEGVELGCGASRLHSKKSPNMLTAPAHCGAKGF